jgi:hypothetical protein
MRDFTIRIYKRLLRAILDERYTIQTFHDYLTAPASKAAIIRHDVDSRKKHSLHFAYIEQALDIRTSYYFRILPTSFDPVIVSLIKNLGHEIGYHYEDLSLARGNMNKAVMLFEQHLAELRQYYPVKTICMHGSPLSRYDNRDIWKDCNYRDYGIIGEPYFDVEYNKVLYLTDTGRTWKNAKISLRDKVNNGYSFSISSTQDIISQLPNLPDTIMFNFHPQRWNDGWIPWLSELVFQNAKNLIKRVLVEKE